MKPNDQTVILVRSKSSGRYHFLYKSVNHENSKTTYRRGRCTKACTITIPIKANHLSEYEMLHESPKRAKAYQQYLETPEGLTKAL